MRPSFMFAAAVAAGVMSSSIALAESDGQEVVVTGQRNPNGIALSNQFRNKVQDIRHAGEEQKEPGWDMILGFGAGVGPVATGSSRTIASGIPVIDLRYKDRFFIGTLEGVGGYLINNDHVLLGASIVPGGTFSRIEKDDKALYAGLGDLKGGIGYSLYGNITTSLADFGLSLTETTGGDLNGLSGTLYTSTTLPVSQKLFLTLDLSTTVADKGIARAAFGVTPQQSALRTKARQTNPSLRPLAAFQPDDVAVVPNVSFSALYRLSPRWTALMSVNYQTLAGKIADSPLTPEDDSLSTSLILVRKIF